MLRTSYGDYLAGLEPRTRARLLRKRSFFFHGLPDAAIRQIRLDEGSLHSVTSSSLAEETTKIIAGALPRPAHIRDLTITDGTACVGGNALNFSRHFRRVHAVEIDPLRHAFLRHNCGVHALAHRARRIHPILGDCMRVIPTLRQDIVFLDPPWPAEGGPLLIAGRCILQACRELARHAPFIVIKAPCCMDPAPFLQDPSIQVRAWTQIGQGPHGQMLIAVLACARGADG